MAVREREQQQQQQQQLGSSPSPLAKRLEPTMRLEPGVCTESLALEVAEQQGMPASVLNKAIRYFKVLQDMAKGHDLGVSQALVEAAGSSARWSLDSSSTSSVDDTSTASSTAQAQQQAAGAEQQQQPDAAVADEAAAAEGVQPVTSRRRRRRNTGSSPSATEQQNTAAAAAAALQEQQVRTLLAQLALEMPLAANGSPPQPKQWLDQQQQLDANPAAAAAAGAAGAGAGAGAGAAGAGAGAVQLRGVVHHLAPGQQPPASHEMGSWVYVIRYSGDVWYVGESQVRSSSTALPALYVCVCQCSLLPTRARVVHARLP
jgi:hypothetical protein